ncbi:MAG: hypothetical protein BGO11_13335 [Solirubrobacterales bacterium 70-9]|nr:MAG: hypothetical protein BGO11_13335 [Solirubrobacterales bacterium 70-9]
MQNQYLAETIAALDAIRGAAHARLATLGTDTVAALDQLEAALVENLAIGRLLDELREDGAWLGSRSAVFSPSLPSGRDPLKATPLRKLLDQLRATLSTEEAGR